MVFPGIGRQAWVSGSLGGGTGRSTAWDTYDGTEDTDWQQLVDETSTSITDSYFPTYNEKNGYKISNTRAVLNFADTSDIGYLGLLKLDADDASNMQVDLVTNGNETTDDIGLEANDGRNIFLQTTAKNQFSIIPYKYVQATDSLTTGSALTHLKTGTGAAELTKHFSDFKTSKWYDYALNEACDATGPNYSSAACQTNFNTAAVGYPTLLVGGSDNGVPEITMYRLDDIEDLFTSPSSALLQDFGSSTDIADSKKAHFTSQTFATDIDAVARIDFDLLSPGATNSSFRNNGNGHSADFFVFRMDEKVSDTENYVFWTNFHWMYFFRNRTSDTQSIGSGNDNQNSTAHHLVYHGPDIDSTTSTATDKFQMIKFDKTFFALYCDHNGDTGGQMYVNTVTKTNEDKTTLVPQANNTEGLISNRATDTVGSHSSASIRVSDINDSTSTNLAYNAANKGACLFKLHGQNFAVVWRKGTDAYISIFSFITNTSTTASITREVDAQYIGQVPEKNITGLALGNGVAVIVCGNYYKFIKVPI
jgi:hypothetical protein